MQATENVIKENKNQYKEVHRKTTDGRPHSQVTDQYISSANTGETGGVLHTYKTALKQRESGHMPFAPAQY